MSASPRRSDLCERGFLIASAVVFWIDDLQRLGEFVFSTSRCRVRSAVISLPRVRSVIYFLPQVLERLH
jgi:hypothetical protein